MGLMDAIQSGFSNYANFNGRARRSEFWYWLLFTFLLSFVTTLIGNALKMQILPSIAGLAVMVPSIAVGVRRLHDIGKSGWFYLIYLIPIVGVILMIVWGTTDSQPGPNMYGPNPKEGGFGDGMHYQ
ncbi:MAG: DUF805 domain-containing protein [Lachnospiraceae bacterium]|nr:DUF805 domain-containing protein [Lachnospiraceae bacterium]